MTQYLIERRTLRTTHVSIGAIVTLFSSVAGAMLLSPSGPQMPLPRAIECVAALIGLAMGFWWMIAWPPRLASRIFVVAANGCVSGCCLAQANPNIGLTGCFTFVVLACFSAVFHCAKAVTMTVLAAFIVSLSLVAEIYHRDGDVVLAGCQLAALVALGCGAPLALGVMLRLMATDIVHSDLDPLTDLLNRRGFHRYSRRRLEEAGKHLNGYFVVTMVDLDDFKSVNDNHGHAAGDRALVDVGQALRRCAGNDIIAARSGGEEFLLAEVSHSPESALASSIRAAVSDTPHGLTASIGVASMPLAALDGQDRGQLIDALVAKADSAMYVAKAAGGDIVMNFDEAAHRR
ncbi:GGDEF domain-containing protein [Mycolicibacterium grossiae]|uniref:GGDEF domain-containing protein n=1 Tax=Mycolicibacterium grossiae TaxID=1552759 RepID=UPI000F7B5AA8|nr:GGDEF domain-containing protein [Mycolicibacterium grossiae]QEM43543.1 GGDEF domain-containing protein [Mycolicibacterium grossiae]